MTAPNNLDPVTVVRYVDGQAQRFVDLPCDDPVYCGEDDVGGLCATCTLRIPGA